MCFDIVAIGTQIYYANAISDQFWWTIVKSVNFLFLNMQKFVT
jgi:hypothetical protein